MGSLYASPSIFTESVSAVTATNTVDLGTMRYEKGNEYRYVYNDSGSAITRGYGVALTSGGSGYSVVCASAVSTGMCHGVPVMTLTTATYGWIQRYGLGIIKTHSAIAANRPISLNGGTGDFLDYIADVASGAASGLTMDAWGPCGINLVAGSGVTTVAWIECRG
jgi:hypothetical protein